MWRIRGASWPGRHKLLEILLRQFAVLAAQLIETIAVFLIAYGAAETFVHSAGHFFRHVTDAGWRKALFMRFGVWLLLGLEFELAADIVRTAIAPTWTDIGQLAAIGVIRTFLNHFLEKDLEKYEPREAPPSVAEAA